MTQRSSFRATGLVLKRTNTGETDRVVTLLTQEYGKLLTIAKGARKLSSSKRAHFEPGNIIEGFFIQTRSWPLLTQSTSLANTEVMSPTLIRHRQLSLLLELYDRLFVEQEIDLSVYQQAIGLRHSVVNNQATNTSLKKGFTSLITQLGYQDPNDSKYPTITEYVSALSDKKVRSYDYLSIGQ